MRKGLNIFLGVVLGIGLAVDAARAAAPVLDAPALFSWAPTAYPQYFNGNQTQGVATVAGYGTFQYAYWASTGNYVGVLDGNVYVTGPISGNQISLVGTLSSFTCRVYNCGCNGPTASSCSAATATAQSNALCTAIAPFYWEIGDRNGAAVSASQGAVAATDTLKIASASKWVYSTYVVQARGGAANLSASDIDYLHFTSGYTNLGNLSSGVLCAVAGTINDCLQGNAGSQDPATVGRFDYDSGHMEKHASASMGLGNLGIGALTSTVRAQLGTDISMSYFEPLLAGGISTTTNDYARMLRKILDGSLKMRGALGMSPVCTNARAPGCNAVVGGSPLDGSGESWHYAIGHWIEDDPAVGDGSFSSAGAFGFYPWVDRTATWYGVVARESRNELHAGYHSAQCGRLIRQAWFTGRTQNASVPN